MKIILQLGVLIMLGCNCIAQVPGRQPAVSHPCVEKNRLVIEQQVEETFHQSWVTRQLHMGEKLYLTVTVDSVGQVVTVDQCKVEILTKKEIKLFVDGVKKRTFCVYNTNPQLSDDEYIKNGNNRYHYSFIYP